MNYKVKIEKVIKAKDIYWTVSRETGYFNKYDKAFNRTLKPKCSVSRETEHFDNVVLLVRQVQKTTGLDGGREAVGRPKNLWAYRTTVNEANA